MELKHHRPITDCQFYRLLSTCQFQVATSLLKSGLLQLGKQVLTINLQKIQLTFNVTSCH